MASNPGLVAAVAALAGGKFDAAKHARGAGGKFTGMGGGASAKKPGGSVAMAHGIFDKLKGKPKSEMLAATKAAGINDNTAKTQLYHWQKKQAAAALAGNEAPTKADLQAAAAKALGVKQAAKEPTAEPKPVATPPKPEPKAAPAATTPVAEKPAEKAGPDLNKLGPTKYVHALADHMKGAEKKAVVAAAVSVGVNKSTAGVQYGKWAAKQAGTPPQMEKSPEPTALQAKQPQDMTNKELDKALDSYQGKINTPNPTASYAPEPYKHKDEYNDYAGGKALTAKLGAKEVYTNKQQGKTFFKSQSGSVYEHTGGAGPMTKVAGDAQGQYHYDPNTKIVYQNQNGVLKPLQGVKTPVFKNDQPYDPGDHVFKDDKWAAGTNGIQDPSFQGHGQQFESLKAVHKTAGVTYNETSSAVKSYTGSGYHAINGELRSSKGQTVGDRAKAIDKLMENSSFKENTIMWRGVGSGEATWNGSPPPPALVDHGFTSVSFKPSVAKGFSNGKTLFRVKVPKGFPGLNVAIGSPGSGEAGLHGEAEVMLPRGTTYKVVARHAKAAGSYDVVDLEPQLPQWWIDKHGSAA